MHIFRKPSFHLLVRPSYSCALYHWEQLSHDMLVLCCFCSPAKCRPETGFSKARNSFSAFRTFPASSPSFATGSCLQLLFQQSWMYQTFQSVGYFFSFHSSYSIVVNIFLLHFKFCILFDKIISTVHSFHSTLFYSRTCKFQTSRWC